MESIFDKNRPAQGTLKIRVPSTAVAQRMNEFYTQISSRAKIPGFRQGKAPLEVVRKHFGDGGESDLSERLISEFLWKTIEQRQLQIVMPPVLLATDKIQEGQDFSFEVEVDLKPDLPPISLNGLTVEGEEPEKVTDEEVEKQLEATRESLVTYVDLIAPRPAQVGDRVEISFDGTVDGERREGMQSDSHTIILGQGQFLKDFEEGILGMNAGETKTVPVKFPSTYHEKSLQDKTAMFAITPKQIKRKQVPELNDEFAEETRYGAKTLLELRQKIREDLQNLKDLQNKKHLREKVGEALVEKHPFSVSPRQIKALADRLLEQTHHMMHEMGIDHSEDEATLKQMRLSSDKKAERDVKLYILEAISREQKFDVTQDDFTKRFEDTARKTGLSLSQVKQYYSHKDDASQSSRMDQLRIDILDEKSLDYALSIATIKLKRS